MILGQEEANSARPHDYRRPRPSYAAGIDISGQNAVPARKVQPSHSQQYLVIPSVPVALQEPTGLRFRVSWACIGQERQSLGKYAA